MTLIDDAVFDWEMRCNSERKNEMDPTPDPRKEMEWLIRKVADRVSEIGIITGEDIIKAAGLTLH